MLLKGSFREHCVGGMVVEGLLPAVGDCVFFTTVLSIENKVVHLKGLCMNQLVLICYILYFAVIKVGMALWVSEMVLGLEPLCFKRSARDNFKRFQGTTKP